MFMKLGRNEVLIILTYFKAFRQDTASGDPGRGPKMSHGGPLLKKYSANRKETAPKRMHSNDHEACGKKCCYFGSILGSNF